MFPYVQQDGFNFHISFLVFDWKESWAGIDHTDRVLSHITLECVYTEFIFFICLIFFILLQVGSAFLVLHFVQFP